MSTSTQTSFRQQLVFNTVTQKCEVQTVIENAATCQKLAGG